METITKYRTADGAEFTSREKAESREALIEKITAVMAPLGVIPKGVEDGKGWLQHDPETVLAARDGIIEICRSEGMAESFNVFNLAGRDLHPLSIVGRILNDEGGPLDKAWSRFARIDEHGREHQQPYFAYNAGPDREHVCIEDRRTA